MDALFKSTITAGDGVFIDYIDETGAESRILVYPRVPFNIADEPEMQASFVGSKIGAMSRMPCSACEVVPKEDGVMAEGTPRDASVMRTIFPVNGSGKPIDNRIAKALLNEFSIHSEWNPCWSIPGYDPFANPGCIIHQLDHGVFDIILDLVIVLLKNCFPAGSVGNFDVRWAQLASFPGGKKFKRGVSTLANATCSEHRIMSMGLPFAIRGFSPSQSSRKSASLDDCDEDALLPEFFLEDLTVTYLRWRWMLAKKRFTVEMRRAIDADGRRLWELIDQIHRFVHDDFPIELGTKLHKVCHWVKWITMFGAPENYSSEIWEGAHKLVKRWRSSMSWKTQGAASRKVMQAHSIYDAHATDPLHSTAPITSQFVTSVWASADMNAPPGWMKGDLERNVRSHTNRRSRFGTGGFRGRSTVARSLGIRDPLLENALGNWESEDIHRQMCLNDRISFYLKGVSTVSLRSRLEMLIRLLSISFCQRSPQSASFVNIGHGECECDADGFPLFHFFTGGNNHRSDLFDFVRVWNKMFVDASSEGAYAEVGSFVEYHSPRNKSKSSKLEIGKLVWMISVFGRQVVIIHKMREVPMKGGPQRGEGFVDQFVRQEEAAAIAKSNRTKAAREFQMDPLKRCFWTLQQLEDDVPSNFDVIILPDSSDDPFPIVSIVMLQPDFSSITVNPNGKEYPKRWFLVEYVLL